MVKIKAQTVLTLLTILMDFFFFLIGTEIANSAIQVGKEPCDYIEQKVPMPNFECERVGPILVNDIIKSLP